MGGRREQPSLNRKFTAIEIWKTEIDEKEIVADSRGENFDRRGTVTHVRDLETLIPKQLRESDSRRLVVLNDENPTF